MFYKIEDKPFNVNTSVLYISKSLVCLNNFMYSFQKSIIIGDVE